MTLKKGVVLSLSLDIKMGGGGGGLSFLIELYELLPKKGGSDQEES